MKSANGFVGDLLLRHGIVNAEAIARASETATAQSVSLGRALASLGITEESVVARTLANALHLDFLELHEDQLPAIAKDVVALLPADFCKKRGVVPLSRQGNQLTIAISNPMDDSAIQDVRFRTGRNVIAVVMTQTDLERLCLSLYPESKAYDMISSATPAGEVEAAAAEDEYELVDPVTLSKDVELPPIVRLVNLILSDAARAGASDVHVEPQETQLLIRQRVDGLLRDVLTVPQHLKDQTVSRIKIISGMDIAERRKPQDGRSRLRFEGRRIDLRVSTLPIQFGEKVVIRLLDGERPVLPLTEVGFSPENLRTMQAFLSRPQGIVLVTGPTGSGKTSTLYTALNAVKSPTNNITTLEDPIEFQLPGVNQTQINARAGVTFASGLRSILRQDPNVILVGEIRDKETAEIALQAALTGHLLLSTLHTNDAASTITRLIDLEVPPFLVASSVLGIVAQRLVRRPCPACAAPAHPGAELIEKCGGPSRVPADAHFVAGKGCKACGGLGVKGRVAVHEVLVFTDEIRDLVASGATELAIKKAARRNGVMKTLFEDGLEKAAKGVTTLEEVLRVATPDEPDEASQSSAAPAISADSASGSETTDTAPSEAPADGERKRVLVVEDSKTVASVVKYFMELEGFEVLLAADGREGLETALRERPNVIVSDLNMPGMGGLEMVKALRADPGTAQVRIIMLSSETSVESETESLSAGADDYIAKPVEPRRLAARVKALMARSKSRAA